MTWLLIALAAAAGATLRYVVDFAVMTRVSTVLPWGTFAVNVSGSLLIGVAAGLALSDAIGDRAATTLMVGFFGAYTTFSTFAYETVRLVLEGARSRALLNALGSLVAGVLAAALGLSLALALA